MTDPLANYEYYAEPDWDGMGADPITPQVLANARTLIANMPMFEEAEIAPGADGSIGFVLCRSGKEYIVTVGPGDTITFGK